MLLTCDNCGAPLDVGGGVERTRCHYCGQTIEVKKVEKVADETPAGWEPPKQWSPPAHSPLAGQSLVYKPIRVISRAIALSIRLGVLAIVGIAIFRVASVVNQATSAASSGAQTAALQGALNRAVGAVANQINAAQPGAASGNGPVTCDGADTITLTGQTLRAEGAGVPVTASGNCHVKLVACRLSGGSAIAARGNAHVTVEGGTLTGVRAALALSGNAAVDVSGGTLVTGAPALEASGNARAVLRDVSVNGAIDTRDNASVDGVGARLLGPITGTRRVRK
jgi:DNA-directed RNA polymerase subunit RPC12/RpoP